MGKSFKILILSIFTIAILITSFFCSKKSKLSQPVPLDQPLNIANSIDPKGTYSTGDISIKTNSAGDIIVLINSTDSSNRKLFVLQGNTKKSTLNRTFNKGEILYLAHAIIVNSLDNKERYYLAVSKPEEQEIFANLPVSYKAFYTDSLFGYGVVQMTGNLPDNLNAFKSDSTPFNDLYNYRKAKIPQTGQQNVIADDAPKSCDSGGPGATSCSVGIGQSGGSCSVSCKQGWFACCTMSVFGGAVCKCTPYGKSGVQ